LLVQPEKNKEKIFELTGVFLGLKTDTFQTQVNKTLELNQFVLSPVSWKTLFCVQTLNSP
jgi:hypothetical protein